MREKALIDSRKTLNKSRTRACALEERGDILPGRVSKNRRERDGRQTPAWRGEGIRVPGYARVLFLTGSALRKPVNEIMFLSKKTDKV